jgi:hypothetical protein
MPQPAPALNEEFAQILREVQDFIHSSVRDGLAVHEAERGLWDLMLQLGHAALKEFFNLHGSGDQGETVSLPDGSVCQRLKELHDRPYVSIFGSFTLHRTAYGSREGQKIVFVPLDNRLQLPASDFSYVLQDWDQALCAEQAFGQVQVTIARMLGLKQPVDSLEHMNREMAGEASLYRFNRPVPPPTEEGAIFVAGADGKGVVMRREADVPPPAAHRDKGEKASQKRMATVGVVYSVDRYVRTPAEVVAALFRDPGPKPPPRPAPCHKLVWASLPQDDPKVTSGLKAIYVWMLWELVRRNPGQAKETVYLHDGQESLWQARDQYLPHANGVDVLDLLHVTPRLWQAAHLFCPEGSKEAEAFMRLRLLRVLQGQAALVIRGWREMATKRHLGAAKRKALEKVCSYLENNLERMHYDRYLAAGYPIASGAVEGACRHVVKDRMERAGMHWTRAGAEAMLEVRSIYVSGHWDEYQEYRISCETQRLYPHRELVEGPQYCMAV